MRISNDLYICSTFYHTLICVLRAINDGIKYDIMLAFVDKKVEEGAIDRLYLKLKECDLFKNVFIEKKEPRGPKNIYEKIVWRHGLYARIVEEMISIDFSKYDDIYIFFDDLWPARYFKDKKIFYNLCEDGLDYLKHISPTSGFWYLIQPTKSFHRLRSLLKLGGRSYEYLTRSKYVKTIEVNDKEGIKLPEDKRIIEVPQKDLLACVNNGNIKKILDIYLEDPDVFHEENIALIMTVPLSDSEKDISEEKQIRIYRDLIEQYKDYNVIIKPHPRDSSDYSSITKARTINRYFPSELIRFLDNGNISKYVALISTSVMGYPKEKVVWYPSVADFYKSIEKKQINSGPDSPGDSLEKN